MNLIWNAGINMILFFQSLGGWLAGPMGFFSFLGTEQFFLVVMPLTIWCIDGALGLRLGFLLLASGSLNAIIKLAIHGPRPYWIDLRVHPYLSETSFGLPSGHAQLAASVWGGLAYSLKRSWAWVLLILIIFFIGLSRIYNGVHFPSDVLAGWILGALILWIYLRLEKPVTSWLSRLTLGSRLLAALAFSLLFILLGALAALSLGSWTIPQLWITNAATAVPGPAPIDPLSFSGIISDSGVLFGMLIGAILMQSWGGFNAGGPAVQRLLRFLLGMVGVGMIWMGLDKIFPGGENLLGFFLRYLRYALAGFWITGLAPLIFVRLRLANKSN